MILALALSLLLVVAMLAASCGGSNGGGATTTASGPIVTHATAPSTTASTAAGGAQVVMKDLAFDPVTVTIKAGQSVTWTNQDSMKHTVVGDNGEFESDNLAKGGTFIFTFDKPGTYAYHCGIHPSMKAAVVVE